MRSLVIFVCSGLLVYWVARTLQLLQGVEGPIDEVLESDVWLGRRLLLSLRAMFVPPQQFIG